MLAAIRLWREYFWPHARAALRQIGLTDRHADSRRALRWIIAHAKYEVSREEIRREALGQRLDAEQTQHLLDRLVKAGWLQSRSSVTGGRKRHRWQVNPKSMLRELRKLRKAPENGTSITVFQLLALSALLASDEQRGGYNLGCGW
jgi:hypothetical protein